VVLVIDAAYAEFVGRNDYSPGIDLVEAGDNVVMTRTFSKIYGMGGLAPGLGLLPVRHRRRAEPRPRPVQRVVGSPGGRQAAIEDIEFTGLARAITTLAPLAGR